MIQVDISNIWGRLSLPDLLGIEAEVAEAHRLLLVEGYPEGTAEEYLSWGFENPLWLYAALRNLMLRSGKTTELLVTGEAGAADLWRKHFAGDTLQTETADAFAPNRPDAFETSLRRSGGEDGAFQLALEQHTGDGSPVVCMDYTEPEELDPFFRLARMLSDKIREP